VDARAQELGADAELAGHPRDRAEPLTPLAGGLEDHPDGPFPELGRVLGDEITARLKRLRGGPTVSNEPDVLWTALERWVCRELGVARDKGVRRP
jgi:hypothetical protein